ncbi:energy-coupling factor transporter transmembrane component T [Nocardioides sp. zg-1228]|uniref:energy-coupling factor transporter transmembrane component T n=1 Tax=Nocardioides sp. zg-1228 TaxID=2763008 RepID=UPI0016430B80|nr:energy-coupling factor transporter transmembrane component T [Nocardioides sp. zg-1228]MBC2933253.1 energy-coupling factor transporter transmembrane protein EcfT [Nocardioides sp. zg-1228]QSF56579.1 energy-coupling factor transporter transmembrane protein EcfT [Nocardioides sp. zg-1228]
MTGSAALPRDLHPLAWWTWAIGLATAASLTTNPLLLLLVMGSATVVVMARRSGHPFGRSFRLYVLLALLTVVLRVVFRIVFGGQEVGHVLLDLPEVPLPDWAAGVRLLGPVTSEALLAGLYDGLRLATIILCVGAANSLANPKRLLASVPPALYEIGTALVVAVTIFPQLADSARRVRAAQALRGGATSGVGRLRRFLVPVLEDALERSLALAAGMDARGYGRSGGATARERWTTGSLLLLALTGICVGTYAWLDPTAPRVLALPMLAAGASVAVLGMVSSGRRVHRTRYRPDPWRGPELVTAGVGVAVAVLAWYVSHTEVAVAYPGVDVAPYLSPLALVLGVLGTLPAVTTPVPATAPVRREAAA